MSDSCCEKAVGGIEVLNDSRWRKVLWIALLLNFAMFGVEMAGGAAAGSRSLQADALDFLGDAANYGISLGVAGMALAWRARAAWVKGLTILLFGVGVFAAALWGLVQGTNPNPVAMGMLGFVALIVNVAVALMLYRYRAGDANMQSVWICSRNDAIGNLLVIGASIMVVWTQSGIPDLLVAMLMASLGISGGLRILRQARHELNIEAASDPVTLAYERELTLYQSARANGKIASAWNYLERGHIISQIKLRLHVHSHFEMLKFAIALRDGTEMVGQILRIILAPLGSALGRIPIGNTGRSNVSPFKPMPLPSDLLNLS